MSPRETVLELLRNSDAGYYDRVRAALDPHCEWINPMIQADGPDQIVAGMAAFAEAFPTRRHEVTTVLQSGSRLAIEGEWVATHSGPLVMPHAAVPATGRTVCVPFAAVMDVRDGRVASAHIYLDPLGFMAQLGLVPEPAAA